MIYAKNNGMLGLPLSIRITSSPEEEWTHASALEDITRSIESELEDKTLGTASASRTVSPWSGAGRRTRTEEGGNAQF